MFYYHYSIKRTNLRHDNSKIMFTAAKLQLFFDICKKKMKKVLFCGRKRENSGYMDYRNTRLIVGEKEESLSELNIKWGRGYRNNR